MTIKIESQRSFQSYGGGRETRHKKQAAIMTLLKGGNAHFGWESREVGAFDEENGAHEGGKALSRKGGPNHQKGQEKKKGKSRGKSASLIVE